MAAAVLLALPGVTEAGLIRSGAGASPADIQAVVDAFRADLGPLNPNTPGSLLTGRREINWAGIPDAFATPNFLPGDFFNQNVPGRVRGVTFATPGVGVQASADSSNPTVTPVRIGNINYIYANISQTFTPERLSSPIGSNIVDLAFFVPGTITLAAVRVFGAVYSEADIAGDTSFEYFDIGGHSLGKFLVPTFNNGLSFMGVSFPDAIVGWVQIVYGTGALGPDDGPGNEVAVMDDLIYGEPQAVSEPSALALAGLGLLGLAVLRRKGKAGWA